MTATRSAEEVYKKYIDRFGFDADGDPDAIALFTYALVEKDKFYWLEHCRTQNNGKEPAPHEVENWYLGKPESYFEEKYQWAVGWYKAFARTLLEKEIQEERLAAIKEYVGDKLKFLPQLWVSLASNFIFIFLLGAIAVYVFADFSPIGWVKIHIFGTAGH